MPSAVSPMEVSSAAPISNPENVLGTLPSTTHPPKTTQHILQETESQWLFSEAELARSPSILAGMAPEAERHLRSKGFSFIMQVGIMLKLPQITLNTASLFFNRFLMRYSLVAPKNKSTRPTANSRPLHVYQIGALALHTSTKVSETPRKVKDIITACVRVALHDSSLLVPEDSKDFWRWRDTLLMHEDLFLETLCFDLTVESPHRLLFDLLKNLGAEHHKRLRNAAWAFLTDAGVTTLGLRFHARVIAGAAVYTAAKHCEYIGEGEGARFPDDRRTGKPWWEAHHLALKDIRRCCNVMAELYELDPENGSPQGRDSLWGGEEANKEDAARSIEGSGENIYVRLRTHSNGPEEEAPTRVLKGKREQSAKRSRDGTPKTDELDSPAKGATSGRSSKAPVDQPDKAEDPATKATSGSVEDEDAPVPKKTRTEVSKGDENEEGSEEGEVEE